jgi:hypothetical protein
MLNALIFWLMRIQLRQLQKKQDTLYIYLYGTGKSFPRYLMYTEDLQIRHKMHQIN